MSTHSGANKSRSRLNVDEEYANALRTKSYADLYAKVHGQHIQKTASTMTTPTKEDDSELRNLRHSHSSPIPLPYNNHIIPDLLLEPSQESLLAAASTIRSDGRFHRHLNALLLDFFDATLQAFIACSSLLSSIESARSHNRSIHRLLLLLTSSPSSSSLSSSFSQLSSQLKLNNPLSPDNLSHFNLIHSRYPSLIRRLTSAHRKVARRQKMVHWVQKASGLALVALFGAMVVAAIVIATHAVVAVAVIPIAAMAGGLNRGKIGRWVKGWVRLETARARMDVAAKGAYIVGRDLDTMSAMVRRVHDEVEHGREVARMVVRSKELQMVKEVVKEMEGRGEEVGMGLEEQLEELEEHVYLCLITINRSRRLVAQEMMEPQPEIVVV